MAVFTRFTSEWNFSEHFSAQSCNAIRMVAVLRFDSKENWQCDFD
jgi:hypothetical protein